MKLFKFKHTNVSIHWSVLFFAIIFINQSGWILGPALFFSLIASILVHEFGHIWVASKFGIKCENVVLAFFGGVADIRLNKETSGSKEIYIALAGPLVSIIVSALSLIIYNFTNIQFLGMVGALNAFLAIFNLLPIYPSDGGRVLRGSLKLITNYKKATQIACYTSYVFLAGLLVLAGLYSPLNIPILLLAVIMVREELRVLNESDNS